MTQVFDGNRLAATATGYGVRCIYKYQDGKFVWLFFRNGVFVGKCFKAENVLPTVRRLTTVK